MDDRPDGKTAVGGFSTPLPVFEWDESEAWSSVPFVDDSERFGDISERLYQCELAYRQARFCDAGVLAERLVEQEADEAVKISASCTLLMACIASNDADRAYSSLREFYRICSNGLTSDDDSVRGTAYMCAIRIEDVLMARIFDMPNIKSGIDNVPSGLKAYIGYLLSLREIRKGNHQKAAGIAFAFRMLMGSHYQLSNIGLTLIMASAALVKGDLNEAESEFASAWETGERMGLVMPFVELNYLLLGLPRRCSDLIERATYRQMEKLVASYRSGWYALRRKCGLTAFGSDLTLLEIYASSLAALGWRNKEIAAFLGIAETTVKHQLTNVYQKMGLSKRADLHVLNEPTSYETVLVI